MKKIKVFAITLNDRSSVYYAGSTVVGAVLIVLEKEMNMREIRLNLFGGAYVWKENRKGSMEVATRETYFDKTVVLRKDHPTSFTLPKGRYSLPFLIELPRSIPCSFETSRGGVKYYLEAVIDRPRRLDSTTEHKLTILPHLDLNTIPNTGIPVEVSKSKCLRYFIHRTGSVTATLKLDRTGYIPGESISFQVECNNSSDHYIRGMKASLIQHVAHSTKKYKIHSKIVSRRGPSMTPYSAERWHATLPPIPPCAPSGLPGCKIISIVYLFQLKVTPKGPFRALKAFLPIYIGTISPSSPEQHSLLSSPAYYLMAPPPSYEACSVSQN